MYPENSFIFKARFIFTNLMLLSLSALMPIFGAFLTGKNIYYYLKLPPFKVHIEHQEKSFFIFLLGSGLLMTFIVRIFNRLKSLKFSCTLSGTTWTNFFIYIAPGMTLMIFSWLLAWGYLKFLYFLRPYYFAPLWLGFILLVNGYTYLLRGNCLLCKYPSKFIMLFPASAIFWWYFEFLNRFVNNWQYLGVDKFTSFKYILIASISFSTVLPAVISLYDLLKSCTNLLFIYEKYFETNDSNIQTYAIIILLLSLFSMFLLGIYPKLLFPILWISPLLIMASIQILFKNGFLYKDMLSGSLGNIIILALSGLICGFLWEMWNYYSYPKWIYLIPYVGQFKIFEMPLLGYAGYLPFGIECGLAVALFFSEPFE